MPDYNDIKRLADRVRPHIVELTPGEVRCRMMLGSLLIDVRDSEELLRNPPIAGALHFTRGRLEYLICDAVSSKDTPLILYCSRGNRSVLAAASLQALDYRNIFVLRGGLHAWRTQAGIPWIPPHAWAA